MARSSLGKNTMAGCSATSLKNFSAFGKTPANASSASCSRLSSVDRYACSRCRAETNTRLRSCFVSASGARMEPNPGSRAMILVAISETPCAAATLINPSTESGTISSFLLFPSKKLTNSGTCTRYVKFCSLNMVLGKRYSNVSLFVSR